MITTTAPKPTRSGRYDEDLLVRLIAEGQLSYRKIAEQVGVSAMTVSNVARGRRRKDLYDRICCTVEDAQRRAHRLASSYLWPLVAAHVKEAIEGTGETARKCREFLIRTFINRPDPAGRYIGHPAAPTGRARPATRGELDLLSAVRGDRTAPKYRDLPKRIRRHVRILAGPADTPTLPPDSKNSQNAEKAEHKKPEKKFPSCYKRRPSRLPDDHPLRDLYPGMSIYEADRMHALHEQCARENAINKPDLPPGGIWTDEQSARVRELMREFGKENRGPEPSRVIEPTWIGKSPDE